MDLVWGLGRRKTSVARVRMLKGKGLIMVNDLPFNEYFNTDSARESAELPLSLLGVREKYDIHVRVSGGGKNGQSGAVLLGIARALLKEDSAYEPTLRKLGLLTRDPRMKERKKPGQKGARARFQFSKR